MVPCRSCGEGIPENSRFCPQCGASLVAETMVTRTAAVSSPAAMLPSRTPSSSGSLDEGRFLPGTLLVDRYRVVALLGRGGGRGLSRQRSAAGPAGGAEISSRRHREERSHAGA